MFCSVTRNQHPESHHNLGVRFQIFNLQNFRFNLMDTYVRIQQLTGQVKSHSHSCQELLLIEAGLSSLTCNPYLSRIYLPLLGKHNHFRKPLYLLSLKILFYSSLWKENCPFLFPSFFFCYFVILLFCFCFFFNQVLFQNSTSIVLKALQPWQCSWCATTEPRSQAMSGRNGWAPLASSSPAN